MSRIDQALHRKQSGEEGSTEMAPASSILDQYGDEQPPAGGELLVWDPAIAQADPPANRTRAALELTEPPGTNGDQLVDVRQLVSFGRFAGGAVRRHKLLTISTFILVLGATAAVVQLWPRTYHVQAKVLAQRNGMMPAISNPARAIPPDADSPTRSASEVILRHDNLVAMIDETDLTRRWQLTRAPILVLKDRVYTVLWGEQTEDERRDALVGLLERRLAVSVFPEETISIDLDWPDRQLAYELVRAAVDNFLETRRTGESSAIGESVSILERSAGMLQQNVNAKFAELQLAQARSQAERRRVTSRTQAPPAPVAVPPPAAPSPAPADAAMVSSRSKGDSEVARLRLALESKQQELATVEDGRRQQLSELRNQLAKDLSIYTENHPAVVSLRETIASISRDSSQLTGLRSEVLALEAQHESLLANERAEQAKTEPIIQAALVPFVPASPEAIDPDQADVRDALDDEANPMVMRLKGELSELADIRARLESARIELATSQAAFKYRYTVVRPAQLPRRPVKPNVPAVLVAGFFGALFLALTAPIGADLLGGERVEPRHRARELGILPLASGVGRQ